MLLILEIMLCQLWAGKNVHYQPNWEWGYCLLKYHTGRFRNIPLEERACGLCRMNEIEDEEHVLCKCPVYDDLRQSLYLNARDVCIDFDTYNCEEKLILRMKYMWRYVSTYIVNAWNKMKNILCGMGWLKQWMMYHMRLTILSCL